jgi:hypothetical protein
MHNTREKGERGIKIRRLFRLGGSVVDFQCYF